MRSVSAAQAGSNPANGQASWIFGALVKQYHTSLSNLSPEGSTRMHRQFNLNQ